MTLEDKVTEIILNQFGVVGKDIRGAASLEDDLGADSLDMVEIIMTVEEEFGIEIADKDVASLTTAKDIIECLKNKHPDACRKYT